MTAFTYCKELCENIYHIHHILTMIKKKDDRQCQDFHKSEIKWLANASHRLCKSHLEGEGAQKMVKFQSYLDF